MKSRMPVLFAGHGSPMNAIEESEFSAGWKRISLGIPKPEAVLCISAHWETKGTFFTAAQKPETIHDFAGFPRQLYEVTYPAPGSPSLASEAKASLSDKETGLDMNRGLDHGAWSVLRWMFPEADIPVVQMSINYTKDPDWHMNAARELSVLREKGVLILGSGNIVHNLRMVDWRNPGGGFTWAETANAMIRELIVENKTDLLCRYDTLGMEMKLAIPSPEHFIPLLYILALQEPGEKLSFFNDKVVVGSISMTSLLIGD
jgi:4,5-DOPA dioxygenase extradiol